MKWDDAVKELLNEAFTMLKQSLDQEMKTLFQLDNEWDKAREQTKRYQDLIFTIIKAM